MEWKLTEKEKPELGSDVEMTDDFKEIHDAVYIEERTCMMAGIAGGYGYFGEGFATNGEDGIDYGLILDDSKYWRYRS